MKILFIEHCLDCDSTFRHTAIAMRQLRTHLREEPNFNEYAIGAKQGISAGGLLTFWLDVVA